MSQRVVVKDNTRYRKTHLYIEEELYYKLWEIVKKRFRVPHKKLYIVVNEALREYVERHSGELGEDAVGERSL
mgnify:CR=1 FL=1